MIHQQVKVTQGGQAGGLVTVGALRLSGPARYIEVLTSSAIYDWAHARRRLRRRKSMPFGVYSRTLRTICDPVERVPPYGAWLWRLWCKRACTHKSRLFRQLLPASNDSFIVFR
jgi:hypothetical protein